MPTRTPSAPAAFQSRRSAAAVAASGTCARASSWSASAGKASTSISMCATSVRARTRSRASAAYCTSYAAPSEAGAPRKKSLTSTWVRSSAASTSRAAARTASSGGTSSPLLANGSTLVYTRSASRPASVVGAPVASADVYSFTPRALIRVEVLAMEQRRPAPGWRGIGSGARSLFPGPTGGSRR